MEEKRAKLEEAFIYERSITQGTYDRLVAKLAAEITGKEMMATRHGLEP